MSDAPTPGLGGRLRAEAIRATGESEPVNDYRWQAAALAERAGDVEGLASVITDRVGSFLPPESRTAIAQALSQFLLGEKAAPLPAPPAQPQEDGQ